MGLNAATLAGRLVTSARVQIPAWGAWYAEASIDGEATLSGLVELKIADLSLRGTVLSGGAAKGRSHFRIVGGAGGWGKTIAKGSYANDAGVKASTVLGDAARLAGETISDVPDTRVGPAYVRPEGPACRALESLFPGAWYVDAAGVTRIGRRARTVLSSKATHGPVDLARGVVTLAADSISGIVPGVVVDGLEAVDVEHTISAEAGLRSTVWGARGLGYSRRLAAFRAILDQLDPDRRYRGTWEYRVVTQEGERLNLQPVRVSTGMPELRRVVVRPGVAGAKSTVALGSRVLVGFVDASPGRPVVLAFEDAEGEGFRPTSTDLDATLLTLAGGSLGVARMTDTVLAGPFAGTITSGSAKVKAG